MASRQAMTVQSSHHAESKGWALSSKTVFRSSQRGDDMGKSQREKGKRGERELARRLREYGYDARRGQQYCGISGDADVIGLPGIHIEVKRTERLSLYDALSQAKSDARPGEMPIVAHRRNNCEWVVIQPLEDWIKIYRECVAANKETDDGKDIF